MGEMGQVIRLETIRRCPAEDGGRRVGEVWRAARGEMLVPTRDRIAPGAFGPALPGTFVIQSLGPGLARFRIAGSTLTRLAGFELRHMPFSCLWRPEGRQRVAEALDALFEEPAEVEIGLEGRAGLVRLWPLRDEDGRVTLGLGHLEIDLPPGAPPARLEPGVLSRRSLIGYGSKPRRQRPVLRPARPHLSLVPE